ncbi:hypothetical protein RvY_13914-1 [Ramazzottius varieornatus]|uniref:Protein quiver n=1 Tax=Ramazzottius varieornatus TaxID=947166 RepID=A0A1D1VWX7_RAMVA|nr:hypothetical protein RvY_13914-1 [Ramazzottius varieornatus]
MTPSAYIVAMFLQCISLLLSCAEGEKCYDCDSRSHKGCEEMFTGFVKECALKRHLLDPEQDRCMKQHKIGSNIVVRSCVKTSSPAAHMEEGTCVRDGEVITCVCSGYLCNGSASYSPRLPVYTSLFLLATPFHRHIWTLL